MSSIFSNHYVAAAKSLQSCPTLCDPIDCSPPGSPIPGILQARVLEWGAIAFSESLCYETTKPTTRKKKNCKRQKHVEAKQYTTKEPMDL